MTVKEAGIVLAAPAIEHADDIAGVREKLSTILVFTPLRNGFVHIGLTERGNKLKRLLLQRQQ